MCDAIDLAETRKNNIGSKFFKINVNVPKNISQQVNNVSTATFVDLTVQKFCLIFRSQI